MNNPSKHPTGPAAAHRETSLWLLPLKILAWPFVALSHYLYNHWFSYLIGRVLRDEDRVYSIKFIWYGDSVYLHPLVWGSVVLFFVTESKVFTPGWPLLTWFVLLAICFLTVIYNFDIIKASVLLVCVIAVFGLAYIAHSQWNWNPPRVVAQHILSLEPSVSPGFYIVAAYVFAALIVSEVVWAWLFNRVEIDESYVYEHRALQSTSREPIFARGLTRETKDLLELLILGAADIKHRTRNGQKTFKNVPGASLGLGRAIDSLLDFRRPGEIALERKMRGEAPEGPADVSPPDVLDQSEGHGDDR
jgi:hypothetical protein